jgi:signal transduction histidine kinase
MVIIIDIALLLAKSKKYYFIESTIIFYLTAISVSYLICTTSGLSSPYLLLFSFICFMSTMLGIYGLAPTLIALILYTIYLFIFKYLSVNNIAALILFSLLPIGLGIMFVILDGQSDSEEKSSWLKSKSKKNSVISEVADKSAFIINAIGDGIIAIDSQQTIQIINPAALELLGWNSRDALSLNYQSVLQLKDKNGHDLPDSQNPVYQALNTNQQVRTSTIMALTKSEKQKLISLVASPAGDTGNGVILVFHDVTSERADERQEAEFISTASHEMRTPVAAIEGYLGLALNPRTAKIDDKARMFLIKAHESSQHLGRLFQDLLDVSKADDGRLPNNPKPTDLTKFVSGIIEDLQPKSDAKGLDVIYKGISDIGSGGEKSINPMYFVNLDNDHLREIISNLLDNAIKYTPNGSVVVDLSGDDERVKISIKDSGIGIPSEDISHLFQKFYRVDNSATREIGGTGLGLYLCRKLVESMGGRIWVESVYKQGSTFFVELPRMSALDTQRYLEALSKNERDKEISENEEKIEEDEQDKTTQPVQSSPEQSQQTSTTNDSLQPEDIANAYRQQNNISKQQPQQQQSYARPNNLISPRPLASTQPQQQRTMAPTPVQSNEDKKQPPAFRPLSSSYNKFNPVDHNAKLVHLKNDNTPLSEIEENPEKYLNNRAKNKDTK